MSAYVVVILAAAATAVVIGALQLLEVITLTGGDLLVCVLILFGAIALAQTLPAVAGARRERSVR